MFISQDEAVSFKAVFKDGKELQ